MNGRCSYCCASRWGPLASRGRATVFLLACWLLDFGLKLMGSSYKSIAINYSFTSKLFCGSRTSVLLGSIAWEYCVHIQIIFPRKKEKKKKRPEYRSSWSVLDSEDLIWFGLDLNSIGAYLIWVRWIRLGPVAPATANYGNLMYHTPITTKWPMFVKGADICLPI